LTLLVSAAQLTQAQTLQLIHSFDGYDGGSPISGLTMDQQGNLYGTAPYGGYGADCRQGACGVVYQLARQNDSWRFQVIYYFKGTAQGDGAMPWARVNVGPDGSIYGTTYYGGLSAQSVACSDDFGTGCGTVFRLKPPNSTCKKASCPWTEEVLYSFHGRDGEHPTSEVVLDAESNLYGTTWTGGTGFAGVAYKLVPVNGHWNYSAMYNFTGGAFDGQNPYAGLVIDKAGNFYGVTNSGIIFELSPNGESWNFTKLYQIGSAQNDGGAPYGALIIDQFGNLFGSNTAGGSNDGGTVFELAPSGDTWTYSVLADLPHGSIYPSGPYDKLLMDEAGNLYGTAAYSGANGWGSAFELTPSGNGYVYKSLHDFTPVGKIDGNVPWSNLVLDAQGRLYGTVQGRGNFGGGGVFEISPQ
jgi:hypothetical protein